MRKPLITSLFSQPADDISYAVQAHRRAVLTRKNFERSVNLPWSLFLYPARHIMRRREKQTLDALIRAQPKSNIDAEEKLLYLIAALTAQAANVDRSQIGTAIATLNAHKSVLYPLISK
ncbi:hypothetical protein [Manganibacter manganicus]|uniref:hypothetical protein n=1 Tax=Manganibacter manganicus TaxID=1873176 RepID=UPI0011184200|nr:hypothetical protein [Pseudaminobacter manganicus]